MAIKHRILFVTLTNDVGSDRLTAEMGRLGAIVAVLGPAGSFASLSRYVQDRFPLPAGPGAWLSAAALPGYLALAARSWEPDAIVPLDELAALALRTLATTQPGGALGRLLARSLGRVTGFEAACHRAPLMEVASRCGVQVPRFWTTQGGMLPFDADAFPLFVKRDHSSGSGGVSLVRNQAELTVALRRARMKHGLKSAVARATGYRHGEAPILLQQAVTGRLAMHTAVCRDGGVIDGISLRAERAHPTKGSSTVLAGIEHPQMAEAARTLVAALGCSGFVSFDFILDRDDRAFLIEMNPRPIGSTHLGRLFGHDLCRAFLDDAPAAEVAGERLAPGARIALFPKELERDPVSDCLERGSGLYHDVPRDDPAIVEAYLRHLVQATGASDADLRRRLSLRQTAEPDRLWQAQQPWEVYP